MKMDFKNYDIDVTKLFITGVGTVVLAGLIGCCIGLTLGKKVKTQEGQMQQIETTQEATEETQLVDNLNKKDIKLGEEKTFEPNEHYICVRMPQKTDGYDTYKIEGAAIGNIPEGYEIYTILTYDKKVGTGSTTGGYDIWFVNNKTVKVKATYSEQYKNNGYYTFGKVVEKEKQLIK